MADLDRILGDPKLLLDLELFFRILLGGFIGAVIGHERKNRDKSAGMRTHAIVGLGAALMMVVSKYGFGDVPDYDASRVAAQIVSGVGFLGAGIIFVRNNTTVSGLTKAAGIWATAGIGLAIGAGMYGIGVAATVLALIGLEVLSRCFKSLGMRNMIVEFIADNEDVVKQVSSDFSRKNFRISSYEMEKVVENGKMKYSVTLVIKAKQLDEEGLLLLLLHDFPGVTVKKII